MVLEDVYQSKKSELLYLQKVTGLTDTLKVQLDELSKQVHQMHDNAECVSSVLKNWDSIMNSISQASLSLLQYTENDYEVGAWSNGERADADKEPPLPETLVRVNVANEPQE
ncbi:AaceriADR217Cp [[Ashbya] aceris (nom. inval.)]|nr:AaceriADR217Cp [[Ashbya] aceris (nom. inval.)]